MEKRYFGFDVHKAFVMVAAVDAQQNVVMTPRKISVANLESWLGKNITRCDEVVIEAMTGTWCMYDLLVQFAGRVVVAHTAHVKLIASSFVKTDKRDALVLGKLLAANILPEVWVPPQYVRDLRSLVYTRHTLVRRRISAKNRIRGILQLNRVIGPTGTHVFEPEYWDELDLPSVDKLRAKQTIAELKLLKQHIKEVEEELTRLSASDPWVDMVPYLLQLPGVGLISAMAILSAIGDIERFPTSKQLVGYAGLGARIYASGQTQITGGITKQGRRELRTTMIEVAWNAIKYSPLWKERFERLAHRMGRQKAAVAIARKILVVIWHVLTKKVADREAVPNTVAKSMLLWSQRNRLATSLGTLPALFTREKLNQLKLGQELAEITFQSRSYSLPPPG